MIGNGQRETEIPVDPVSFGDGKFRGRIAQPPGGAGLYNRVENLTGVFAPPQIAPFKHRDRWFRRDL
jgi:hypothetical protein